MRKLTSVVYRDVKSLRHMCDFGSTQTHILVKTCLLPMYILLGSCQVSLVMKKKKITRRHSLVETSVIASQSSQHG